MSFLTILQQALPSFFGSLFGFIFAIVLFFLKNAYSDRRSKQTLLRHLRRELQYDASQVQGFIDELEKDLRQITAGSKPVLSYLRYTDVQRYFIQMAYGSAVLLETLDDEELFTMNRFLNHVDLGSEQYTNGVILQWNEGKAEQHKVYEQLEYQRGELAKYRKFLEKLLTRFQK